MNPDMARSRSHTYGLRAAVFGGMEVREVAGALRGEDYCHPVTGNTFGRFGTLILNETRASSWRGAFVTKPVGGDSQASVPGSSR